MAGDAGTFPPRRDRAIGPRESDGPMPLLTLKHQSRAGTPDGILIWGFLGSLFQGLNMRSKIRVGNTEAISGIKTYSERKVNELLTS